MFYPKLCHDFSSCCLPFQSIDMKRFSASEDDNKVGRQGGLGYFYLINSSDSCVKAIRKTSTHLTEEQKQLRKTEKIGRRGCAENTQWEDEPAPTGSLAPDVHYFSLIVLFPNIFYFLVSISSVFIT